MTATDKVLHVAAGKPAAEHSVWVRSKQKAGTGSYLFGEFGSACSFDLCTEANLNKFKENQLHFGREKNLVNFLAITYCKLAILSTRGIWKFSIQFKNNSLDFSWSFRLSWSGRIKCPAYWWDWSFIMRLGTRPSFSSMENYWFCSIKRQEEIDWK